MNYRSNNLKSKGLKSYEHGIKAGQRLLVERPLPTPEIRGSNSNISKILSTNYKFVREKTKISKKRPGKAFLLGKNMLLKLDYVVERERLFF